VNERPEAKKTNKNVNQWLKINQYHEYNEMQKIKKWTATTN